MRLAVIVALLSVAGWTGVVQAQQDQAQQDQKTTIQSGGQQPLIMSPNEKLLEGQVLDDKNVDMEAGKDHRIIQLKQRNGQTIYVDLGTKDTLPKGFDIRKGQWVLVSGVYGNLGNQPVFVAHRWANVFNLSAGGSTPSAPTERLPGQKGEGGSKSDSDDSYHPQYRDYPGHVGESGPGAGQPNKGEDKTRD